MLLSGTLMGAPFESTLVNVLVNGETCELGALVHIYTSRIYLSLSSYTLSDLFEVSTYPIIKKKKKKKRKDKIGRYIVIHCNDQKLSRRKCKR
jgi:hypothetical protein